MKKSLTELEQERVDEMLAEDERELNRPERTRWAGIEVPVIGLDSLKWLDVYLPPPDSSYVSPSSSPAPIAPLTEDAASCFVIGDDPRTYLIWRIHKDLPHSLELLELNADRELPKNGLRIIFHVPLCPFAFICKDEISGTPGNPYLLHTLTITGVAYIVKLRSLSTYISHPLISKFDFIEFNLQRYPNIGKITAVAATPGHLLVGKMDGSVSIFQLGIDDQTATGFLQELRGEPTGLWRLMPSLLFGNRTPGYVLDLVITELNGRKILFVLNVDHVQAWDMSNHCCIFYNAMNVDSRPTFTRGGTPLKLWVGEVDYDTRLIQLSISYKVEDPGMKPFNIFYISYKVGGRIKLSLEYHFQSIPFRQGEIVHMKLTPKKVWVMTKEEIILIHLRSSLIFSHDYTYYVPQDIFVADQLFQYIGHDWDNLLSITHSIYPSAKDQAAAFVSLMCLCRLLQPGVYNCIVLRATIQDYNKNWTDSYIESLTVDQLRKEISSLIAHEANNESLTSIVYGWKLFFTRYLHHWCKSSALFGMFVESSTGAVCLIRKHSLSLFRCLKDIELLIHGSVEKADGVGLRLVLDPVKDCTIYEILVCANYLSLHLGRSASAICYESLLQTSSSSEEIISLIVKMLETGYSSSLFVSEAAINACKKSNHHKRQREFAVAMFLKLQALCREGTTWSNALDAIQSYLEFLAPQKTFQKFDSEVLFSINTSVCIQSTIQVAKMMFESAFDILLLLRYLVSSSAQIHMSHTEVSRIQCKLVPTIQEILKEWLIVHYIGTTPSQRPAHEDFISQFPSLLNDRRFERKSWIIKLGNCNFTLPFVLLQDSKITSAVDNRQYSTRALPSPQNCTISIHDFTSWVAWGRINIEEEPCSFFRHIIMLTSILHRHGQYHAVEILLSVVDSWNGKISESFQDSNGELCTLSHLMGCTLLARAHFGLHGLLKEQKISEAVRYFFRASASQKMELLIFSSDTEAPYHKMIECKSVAAWKLRYYQCVKREFEQYNMNNGARMFAFAALEQADEAHHQGNKTYRGEDLSESPSTIKGRLWADVFKFSVNLDHFHDAYCAIITNPDVESKYACLRRFLTVLYKQGALKILCDGELPFVGLIEKVEQELLWKAGRSDIFAKANPYKLLYAFEVYRHNWRKAATYMYLYAAHLRAEIGTKDRHYQTLVLQEILNALSVSINALQLVNPTHAWIDPYIEGNFLSDLENDLLLQRPRMYLDIEKLENEFLLTSAENMLLLANVKWTYSAADIQPLGLLELLVQTHLYDMAFTLLLRFWNGSGLKREMERVFQAIALECIPDFKLLGTGSFNTNPFTQNTRRVNPWEILELHLYQYKSIHARLPVIVAETLLRIDSQIELPLWLVQMFKNGETTESCPAALLRIYADYGRYTEATNLALEYIKSFTCVRPGKLIYRRRSFDTSIERLWCQLEDSISLDQNVERFDKLKTLLHEALSSYLKQVKVDSIDAQSFAFFRDKVIIS